MKHNISYFLRIYPQNVVFFPLNLIKQCICVYNSANSLIIKQKQSIFHNPYVSICWKVLPCFRNYVLQYNSLSMHRYVYTQDGLGASSDRYVHTEYETYNVSRPFPLLCVSSTSRAIAHHAKLLVSCTKEWVAS